MPVYWLALMGLGCGTHSYRASAASVDSGLLIPLWASQPGYAQLTRRHVVLVDFWAAWCVACKTTIPQLRALNKSRAERFLVVGINVGEERPVVESFVNEAQIAYPVYLDPEFRFADASHVDRLPTLLIFDRDGRQRFRGEHLSAEALQVIKRLTGR